MRAVFWLAIAVSAGLHAALLAWPSVMPANNADEVGRSARLAARFPAAPLIVADRFALRGKEAEASAGTSDDEGPKSARAGIAGARLATAPPDYWPAAMLERTPVPVSAPDTRMLQGADLPAGMLRIELFIDSAGHVRAVRAAQQAGQMPGELPAPIADMFLATRFLPGQRGGLDVPSRVTLEISIQDLLRIS